MQNKLNFLRIKITLNLVTSWITYWFEKARLLFSRSLVVLCVNAIQELLVDISKHLFSKVLNYKNSHYFFLTSYHLIWALDFRHTLGNSLGINLASDFSIKKNLSLLNSVGVNSGDYREQGELLQQVLLALTCLSDKEVFCQKRMTKILFNLVRDASASCCL